MSSFFHKSDFYSFFVKTARKMREMGKLTTIVDIFFNVLKKSMKRVKRQKMLIDYMWMLFIEFVMKMKKKSSMNSILQVVIFFSKFALIMR